MPRGLKTTPTNCSNRTHKWYSECSHKLVELAVTKGTTGSKYKNKNTWSVCAWAVYTAVHEQWPPEIHCSSSAQGTKKRKRVALSIERIIEMLDKCGFGMVDGGISVIQTMCLSKPLDFLELAKGQSRLDCIWAWGSGYYLEAWKEWWKYSSHRLSMTRLNSKHIAQQMSV